MTAAHVSPKTLNLGFTYTCMTTAPPNQVLDGHSHFLHAFTMSVAMLHSTEYSSSDLSRAFH